MFRLFRIESVEELTGKTVAVPFATTTHFDMLKALELADMTQQDLELLDMSPQEIAATFERGDIDAGWVWFPALARLLDAGRARRPTGTHRTGDAHERGDAA